MLGRLELGDVEESSYYDPHRLCDVDVTFRHATPGELSASMAKAGLDLHTVDGDAAFKLRGESTTMGTLAALEDADVHLAETCIISAFRKDKEGPSDHVKSADLYRKALVAIGKYVRQKAGASDDEGKPSEQPSTGSTSKSSDA